ncbi:jupiter microtubule associated homolog 1 isoform X1 [Dendrobates tinctorius]|uniref:jupiter microtubule associated homolog 1 isoform X1 n=1 Tax=Dendrobates tinctorius TaxID=92724 RepID=UPI003CC936D9
MTTTSTFKGLDPESRSSSRVLRPPGGGSSFSFGVEASKQQQPARRHKMASNIFGIPDNEPAPTSCASEPGASESAACGDEPHVTCAQDEYSDATDYMVKLGGSTYTQVDLYTSIYHLFWSCPKVKALWLEATKHINTFEKDFAIAPQRALLSLDMEDVSPTIREKLKYLKWNL